ncbi:MAG: hypothetical protein CM1200mP25_3140 [Acidobacteriota bacterium]|nr:MAG: hypothetical protein CM1200mP25_3140 [Acidobacteriota bacterium]
MHFKQYEDRSEHEARQINRSVDKSSFCQPGSASAYAEYICADENLILEKTNLRQGLCARSLILFLRDTAKSSTQPFMVSYCRYALQRCTQHGCECVASSNVVTNNKKCTVYGYGTK